jgi:preprotein translocase subunit SecY
MSRTTFGIFIASVVMLFVALLADNTFIAGGSGLVLLVGVIYAYVVTRRDEERARTGNEGA